MMKKLVWLAIIAILLTSCGGETYKTPGMINRAIEEDTTQVVLPKNDGVVLFESDIGAMPDFRERKIELINDKNYLITVNNGGVHGPFDFCYYVCNTSGKLCLVKSPGEQGNTEYSKLQNIKEKYYFTFDYNVGNDEVAVYKKIAYEADTSTGKTREIKLNEIPGNLPSVTPIANKNENIENQKQSNNIEITEEEIEKNTGIVKHPSQEGEGWGSGSSVSAIQNGEYIIVIRHNDSSGPDLSHYWYDLIAVFEKSTWKKVWEITDNVDDMDIFGSMILVRNGNFIDIATGKPVSQYSKVCLIDRMDNQIFVFAEKEGKPKLVVLNLDKIDELKN